MFLEFKRKKERKKKEREILDKTLQRVSSKAAYTCFSKSEKR